MKRADSVKGSGFLHGLVRALHEWPGWFIAAAGLVLCVLGWYGVSGERFVEQQLPYLASATVPGAALIVAGVILVAVRSPSRGVTDRRVAHLYALLVEQPGEERAAAPAEERPGLVALPDGTLYHRPSCPLVTGKEQAETVSQTLARERGLSPCPVCDPDDAG